MPTITQKQLDELFRKTCKTCKFFIGGNSCRNTDKFVYTGDGQKYPKDGLGYSDYDNYYASFEVGPNFGCIHHTKD